MPSLMAPRIVRLPVLTEKKKKEKKDSKVTIEYDTY
jgi:hypothetical protein